MLGDGVEAGDQGGGGRGEGGGSCALAQTGRPQQRGVVGEGEQGRGRGECEQSAEQYRAGADLVGQGAEDGLEEDLGAVVQGEQAAQDQERLVVSGGEAAQVRRDAVGTERGGEARRVQGPQLGPLRLLSGAWGGAFLLAGLWVVYGGGQAGGPAVVPGGRRIPQVRKILGARRGGSFALVSRGWVGLAVG